MAITKVTRNLLSTGIDDQSNATAITIDSSENVGIGRTPNANGILQLNVASGNNCNITFSENTTEKFLIGSVTSSNAFRIYDLANSAERMRIDSSGNVGIGTISPENNLHIGIDSGGEGILVKSTGDHSALLQFNVNRTDGNRAIGQLNGLWNGTSVADIQLKTGSDTTNKDDGEITFHTSSADNIAERMRINSLGLVGINTTSPSQLLSVVGTASTPPARFTAAGNTNTLEVFGFATTDASNGILCNAGTSANDYSARFRKSDGTVIMEVSGDGNVGIGTDSPSRQLTVQNSSDNAVIGAVSGTSNLAGMVMGDTSDDDRGAVLYNNSGDYMYFQTDASERMRIDSAGVILRGTTTRTIGTLGDVNAFGVVGNSAVNAPMVVFAETDATVETSSCILELSYSADTSFNSSFYALFSDSGGTQGTISGTGSGTVAFNISSDERIKENIVDTGSQLETIKQIQVRDFNYIGNDTTTTGMIAQELNTILPNVVQEGAEDATKHPWGIDYGKLTPYLIKAIQELSDKVDNQQTIIDDLKTRIETLENA